MRAAFVDTGEQIRTATAHTPIGELDGRRTGLRPAGGSTKPAPRPGPSTRGHGMAAS